MDDYEREREEALACESLSQGAYNRLAVNQYAAAHGGTHPIRRGFFPLSIVGSRIRSIAARLPLTRNTPWTRGFGPFSFHRCNLLTLTESCRCINHLFGQLSGQPFA